MVVPPLSQEIVIRIGCEVGLGTCLATQGFTGTDELQVVQTAGDTLVAVGVEGIQIDACATIHAGVDRGAGQHRITVSIHDAGRSSRVGVDEVSVGIGGIIRSLDIAVAQRGLDSSQRRYALAIALQLGLALLVGGFDCRLDLCNRLGIGLGDDETDTVLGSAAVDALRLPDIGVRPTGVGTGDDLHRVVDSGCVSRHIHECILTRCTEELRDADLLDLFDIMGVDISDEHIEDFGDKEYVMERIAKELNVQFNTRKQLLLKTLYAYIANSSALDDLDCFSMFGTNSFNLVWEKVCAEVMDNQLQKPIGGLRLPVPLTEQYRNMRHKKLIDLIDKPQWSGTAPTGEPFVKQAEDTLIPDLISIVCVDGNYQFIIFDAKYYNIQFEHNKKLRGQPGIESITKQYLYQLAYQPFVEAHQINTVRNCFLMPTASMEIVEKGTVSLTMLRNLGLQDIQVRLLPAKLMYQHYIENTKIDIRTLNL